MDEAWKLLELENYQRAVIGKYVEGNVDQLLLQTGGAPSPMTQEHYYYVMTHLAAASHHIPKDFKIFMTGIVSKQMLLEVGGFDCSLETMGMSLLDMSIRMQLRGCKMVVQPSVLITCGWDIGDSGDHAPVNRAFNENDMPKYQAKWRGVSEGINTTVEINNYLETPNKWTRRFA